MILFNYHGILLNFVKISNANDISSLYIYIYISTKSETQVLREGRDIGNAAACEILLLAESSRKLHSFQEPRRVAISGVLNLTVWR